MSDSSPIASFSMSSRGLTFTGRNVLAFLENHLQLGVAQPADSIEMDSCPPVHKQHPFLFDRRQFPWFANASRQTCPVVGRGQVVVR